MRFRAKGISNRYSIEVVQWIICLGLSWKGHFLLFVLILFFLVFICGLIGLLDLYLYFIFIFCLFGLGRLNEYMWRCNCLVALECFCFCLSWGICVVHLDLYFGVKIVFGNFFIIVESREYFWSLQFLYASS